MLRDAILVNRLNQEPGADAIRTLEYFVTCNLTNSIYPLPFVTNSQQRVEINDKSFDVSLHGNLLIDSILIRLLFVPDKIIIPEPWLLTATFSFSSSCAARHSLIVWQSPPLVFLKPFFCVNRPNTSIFVLSWKKKKKKREKHQTLCFLF